MSDAAILSPFAEHVAFAAVFSSGTVPPVHPDEEALLHPRASEGRKRSFRLGRVAAHRALEDLRGHWVPVLRGHHRQPLWPPGVVGSIAHTNECGVAAVARRAECGGIGVDIERRRPVEDVADLFAGDAEQSWLDGLPRADRNDGAIALFSAKEAIYKAFYPRIEEYFGFDAVELVWNEAADCFIGHFTMQLDSVYTTDHQFVVDCRWVDSLVVTSIALPPGT